MSDLTLLIIAISLFIGTHELLSHPLRAPIVRAVGEKGFLPIYALTALGTLFWAMQLWKGIPQDRLWQAPGWLYAAALVVMLVAAILFVGSVTAPNPALMGGGAPGASGPRGVQRITRHPMMWAFALWALVHITLSADSRTIVLASGLAFLALFGSAMQDKKKRAANPDYGRHMAATSFVPFGMQLSGRSPLGTIFPGWVAVGGGLLVWAVILWGHPLVIGVPAIQGF